MEIQEAKPMDARMLNTIANFIWGIADDCLRDVYVRGKYRDVILPMTVIRRLDAVLEDTKLQVLEMKKTLDTAGITNQWGAMGTIFEELVRRFNEANNEEAGEHWTPRDVVELMADLVFVPIADQIKDATYSCYEIKVAC